MPARPQLSSLIFKTRIKKQEAHQYFKARGVHVLTNDIETVSTSRLPELARGGQVAYLANCLAFDGVAQNWQVEVFVRDLIGIACVCETLEAANEYQGLAHRAGKKKPTIFYRLPEFGQIETKGFLDSRGPRLDERATIGLFKPRLRWPQLFANQRLLNDTLPRIEHAARRIEEAYRKLGGEDEGAAAEEPGAKRARVRDDPAGTAASATGAAASNPPRGGVVAQPAVAPTSPENHAGHSSSFPPSGRKRRWGNM